MASPFSMALAIASSKRILTSFPLATKAHTLKFLNKTPLRLVSKVATTSPLRPKATTTTTTSSGLQVPQDTTITPTAFPKLLHSSPFTSVFTPHQLTDTEPFFITASDGDSDDETHDNNVVEEIYKTPFLTQGSEFPSDMIENDGALYARFDMPGIGKEGVKLYMDMSTMTLHIEGEEGLKDPEYNKEETASRKYSTAIVFAPGCIMANKIKASMKDGVLRVVVPKIKLQDKKDVLTVTVN